MEVEKSKEGDGDFPWMSCVMGCRPSEDKEVTLLKCLHVICSPTCNDNWRNKLNLEEGSRPYCLLCRMLVKEEDLKEKVILKKIFPPKLTKDEVKLICEMCIHDKPATSYCPTCPHYLCDSCADFHSNLRSSFNHKLEKNLEQRREIEFHKMLENHNQCKVEDHAGSPIIKYCTTCQQKLCALCDHDASHKILETKKGKELFIENLESTKELYKKLGETIEKTQRKRKEFSPRKYIAITSKISKDFARMNQTLRKCHELTIEEVRKAFKHRITTLAQLETRLDFMKMKMAQMCKAYGSVEENLDEVATYHLSLLASESRENVNKFAEILKNGHLDMIEDSKEFSLDQKFMKRVQTLLEKGPVKMQYEMDFKNLDDTASVALAPLDGDTKAEDAGGGGGASSEKDITVTSVSSLNPSASPRPKRRVAVKSTGYGGGRALGMPHLERRSSLNQKSQMRPKSSTPALQPFMNGKPVRTCPAPNRKPATTATSTSQSVPSTSSVTITPIPSTSVSKEETYNGETADEMEVDSSSKTNVVEEPTEAKQNGEKDNSSVTVQSPGISPNGTSLSDSSDNDKGLRNRKKKIYPECVDLTKDVKFSKKEDMLQDSSESTVLPSLESRTRRKCQRSDSESPSPHSKLARLLDTGSENGFESGRQSLRKRGDSSVNRPSTPALASDKKKGKGKTEAEMHDSSKWKEAPLASVVPVPDWVDFPIQGVSDLMKTSEADFNDDYCCICLDGGEETMVCCDTCPKVFHPKCHMPVVEAVPGDDEEWMCNYHKSKEEFEQELSNFEDVPLSQTLPLTKSNQIHFLRACKFMMEVYKIPEIPTMKWNFPEAYQSKYNQVPYHISYLRDKLCLYDEKNYEPFSSMEDFFRSFHQMFMQALHTYQTMNFEEKDRKAAFACYRKYRILCGQYYPSSTSSVLCKGFDLEAIFLN